MRSPPPNAMFGAVVDSFLPKGLQEVLSDHRIQQYLRGAAARGRDVERVGPFLATFNARDAMPYTNYAIPDDGARPTAADVAALVDAYNKRDRLPRLEYLPNAAPDVEAALIAGGFVVEALLPGMVCEPPDVVALPAPDGIVFEVPASDDDWHELDTVQHVAFGVEPSPATAAERAEAAERGRERLADGGLTLLARDVETGAVVGGGVATVPGDGVTEIAGIGVSATHRRRGIAGALTASLASAAFAAGIEIVWLTPGDAGAHRVYARAGFTDATTILHVSLAMP
ncbi:GNAT family N-acetyltransferase [Baekduia sp. Peel2402]|uniref:GNAT family N-acetyltransferase n=1 Tax=Baekduia sp. Peel2402 TaxID=3458296 RepID=UPI00403E68F8